MRKFILFLVLLIFIPTFSANSFAQTLTDCWNTHMVRQISVCSNAYTECLKPCSVLKTTAERKVCFAGCDKAKDVCADKASADYKACVEAGKQKAQQTKLSSSDIKSFLDQLAKIQQAIDQCPPPRIPSESTCVAVKLPSLDIPLYTKDTNLDPQYSDVVILNDAPIQIVSFSKDTKVPNSVDANKYAGPSSFTFDPGLLTPKSARSSFVLVAVDTISTVAKFQYTITEDKGSYSGFKLPDKEWVSNNYISNLDRLDKMVLDSNAKVTLANFPDKSVMEVSSGARIVAAGMAGDDTVEAAKDFVGTLSR